MGAMVYRFSRIILRIYWKPVLGVFVQRYIL